MLTTARQSPPGSPGGEAAPFGAAPGDDSATAAELAALSFVGGRGYECASVDSFRRKALNTVEFLELQVAQLKNELETLRQKVSVQLSPEAVSRGLASLALEMRDLIGERDPAVRQWFASELSAIVGANDRELSHECAVRLPALFAEAFNGPSETHSVTIEWLEQMFGGGLE